MKIYAALSVTVALLLCQDINHARANSSLPTYSENKCLPSALGWMPQGSQSGELMWFNAIEVTPGQAMWNGNHVSNDNLRNLLTNASRNHFGSMVLIIDPSLTCEEVNELRDVVTEKMKCGPERICVEYSTVEWRATLPPLPPANGS